MTEVDLAECDVEVELMDLGDAAVETRQIAPGGQNIDSTYGFGVWPGR
jgi:hypothetical protein